MQRTQSESERSEQSDIVSTESTEANDEHVQELPRAEVVDESLKEQVPEAPTEREQNQGQNVGMEPVYDYLDGWFCGSKILSLVKAYVLKMCV